MTNLVQFPGLGWEFNISRVMFSVGSFNIYWYGFIIACGLGLALLFVFRHSKTFGLDEDKMIDVLLLSIICGVIGARVYYVAFAPFEYESLWDMINIRDGGLAIYGGIIFGFASGYFFCKWRKVPVLPLFDAVAMAFLIGQGIGRWGNFFNQEAFGTNTTMPWGMYSEGTRNYLAAMQGTLAQQGVTVDPSMPVHPTFLYESIWCLVGFALLYAYMKKRKFNGEISLMYVMWYGVGRFIIEGLRTDSLMTPFAGLRVSQLVALGSVLVALVLWVLGRKKYKGVPLTASTLACEAAANIPDIAAAPEEEFVEQAAEAILSETEQAQEEENTDGKAD